MVGGVLPIVFFALVSAFVPSSSSPAADFPAVRTATLVAETVYLAAIALWAVLVLALFRALRGDALRRLKRALIGSS